MWGGLLMPAVGESAAVTVTRVIVGAAAGLVVGRLGGLSGPGSWALLVSITMLSTCRVSRWWTAVLGAGTVWWLGTQFISHQAGGSSWQIQDRGTLVLMTLVAAMASAIAALARREADTGSLVGQL
jgi:ABC-type dipeptide/oligopeptide/nickel transport system permease component